MDDALALWLGILCIWLPRIVEIGIRDLFQLPKQLILAEGAWFAIVLATIMAWAGRPLRLQKPRFCGRGWRLSLRFVCLWPLRPIIPAASCRFLPSKICTAGCRRPLSSR